MWEKSAVQLLLDFVLRRYPPVFCRTPLIACINGKNITADTLVRVRVDNEELQIAFYRGFKQKYDNTYIEKINLKKQAAAGHYWYKFGNIQNELLAITGNEKYHADLSARPFATQCYDVPQLQSYQSMLMDHELKAALRPAVITASKHTRQ